MPAATVSFVASSTRMNAPVGRSSAYGSTASGSASRRPTRAMSLSSSASAGPCSSVVTSSRCSTRLQPPAHGAGRVLDAGSARPGAAGRLGEPAQRGGELAHGVGRGGGRGEEVAARRRRRRRPAGPSPTAAPPPRRAAPAGPSIAAIRDALAARQDDDLVADAQDAGRDRAGVAAVVGAVRPDDRLDREARRLRRPRRRRPAPSPGARAASGPRTTACASLGSTTLSPCSAEIGT